MAKLSVLLASIALWLVAVSAASDVTRESRRLKGGREWRGEARSAALNLDKPQLSEQTDPNVVIGSQGQLKAVKLGLRQQTTHEPRLPSHSATEYESKLTTTGISSTVDKTDGEKIVASIEPLSQMFVSTESAPVLASDVDEDHLETSFIQSELVTSQPVVTADIKQHQKSKNRITETNKTSKAEMKSDKIASGTIPIEQSIEGIGESNPLISNSGESSDEDSVDSRDVKSESKENSLQPSTGKTNSKDPIQRQNHASRTAKSNNKNQNNTTTNSHPRPLPVVAVNLNHTPKPKQIASKPTPAPPLSHGNRRMLPPLGLHPKSPWIRKNHAQGSSTPLPANNHIQQRKPHVQATATLVPVQSVGVQKNERREYVSETSVPVHSDSDQQRINMVQETATTVHGHASHVQHRKNIVEVIATSVPKHGSNVQLIKNRVGISATSNSENVQKVPKLQTDVPLGVKTADSDENEDSNKVTEKRIIPSISLDTPQQIVSNIKHTENKNQVTKNKMSKNGHYISKTQSIVSSSSDGRLAKVQKLEEKNAPGEKSSRKVAPKKRPESSNVDVKPQASSAQLISRHSTASNAVAITSIGLISFVTFLTIMGVYFKKISFSRKRYGQHILLSTEEDDLPLFNRQTNYNNYESPYKSWQAL